MKYRVSKTEVIALTLTGIFLGLGIYLGLSNEAAWLGRFGSLIIIIGVLLAATRFTETLASRVDTFLKNNGPLIVKAIIEDHKNFHGRELSHEYKSKLIRDAEASLKENFSAYQSSRIRVFKLYEIGIVSFGTLVNGFGELFINFILCVL